MLFGTGSFPGFSLTQGYDPFYIELVKQIFRLTRLFYFFYSTMLLCSDGGRTKDVQ